MVRLHINVGRKNNVAAKDIVGAFAGEAGVPAKSIGVIDIYDKFSFVDVQSKYANEVIDAMNNNQIKGRTVTVNQAKAK
jgi:ATP-dependent RNA helicase DeaD